MPPAAESLISSLSNPAPAEPPLASLPVTRQRCAACGATLAPDQRYCVECGQRCGPACLPFTGASPQPAKHAPSSPARAKRPRPSVNATLIAGIGTLLLAMGVGVLIGRVDTGLSSKSPPVQVVTVAGAGGAGMGTTAGTAATEAQAPSTAAKTPTPSAAAAAKSAKAAAKPAVPPAKVVKVGSKGSGPGYQHGHFTGNFFGE